MPLDVIADAQDRHDELLWKAEQFYGEGRIDEAMMVAESIIDENPNAVKALSLLGMCQERYGDLTGSLKTYERVLEIQPDSALEKIRVQHLRKTLNLRIASKPFIDKRLALIGATTAGCFMIVLAIALAVANASSSMEQPVAGTIQTQTEEPLVNTFSGSLGNESEQSKVPPSVTPDSREQPQGVLEEPVVNNVRQAPGSTSTVPKGLEGTLPNPGTTPLKIEPELVTGINPRLGSDPAPKFTQDDPKTEAPQTEPEPPVDDPGLIEITVHRGSPPSQGGGQTIRDDANELQVLVKSANEQFQLGHYDVAAKSYEKALLVGGDEGKLGQRLGQCYEKLGRKSDAARCYEHAIASYEATLKSGSGDPDRLARAIESCKQAIKALS